MLNDVPVERSILADFAFFYRKSLNEKLNGFMMENFPGSKRTKKPSRSCLDTRQPGTVFKKLDTPQSEILTNFLEIARLIPLRT